MTIKKSNVPRLKAAFDVLEYLAVVQQQIEAGDVPRGWLAEQLDVNRRELDAILCGETQLSAKVLFALLSLLGGRCEFRWANRGKDE